jgi:hypothetical protein
MRTETLIPESDVRAALDAAIAILAQTSKQHAEEIGGYVRKAFRPNPKLSPIGVAIMFHGGCHDLRQMMTQAIYPEVLTNMVSNMVLMELRKLPGVDDIFRQFEASR